jgi:uncharacterized repeat protein (TIGR01451 family)
LLTLQPGQTVILYANYTVPSNTLTCSLCNLATVSSITFDPELCNNEAKDCTALVENAALSVFKTDGVTTLSGSDISAHVYSITVGNNGPSTARDVVVTDRWPVGVVQFLQSITTSQGACVGVGGDFTCSVGDIAVGSTVTVRVSYNVMQPPMCGFTVSNWVAAFSPTDVTCREAWDNNTIVCLTRDEEVARPVRAEIVPLPKSLEVVRSSPTPVVSFTPRPHTGKVLSPKIIGVDVIVSGNTLEISAKNSLKRVEIESISLQLTMKTGKVLHVNLGDSSSDLIRDNSCPAMLGHELIKGWSVNCKVSLVDTKDIQSVKVDVRGASEVFSGYHPVMGTAIKQLRA